MMLGMFEFQRGNDAIAAQAFTKAETLRTSDAMAPYYLSQALLRMGENQQAVDAMERAIARKPQRTDLLEIFQQLGRVHQRAQRTDEALAVWKRLEELFPDDPRVLEQIAVTLVDEGEPELALPRYQQLAASEQDDYRKATYRIAAAEIIIRTQNREKGLEEFESILADLNPDGWLFRDVRRRIEDVFLKSSDQDSLVRYYEKWIESHPDDVEAMTRIARFLSASARVPEATLWMEKALKLAPGRSDLRKSYIDQLIEQKKYAEAAEQYKVLCDAQPNNVDFLSDWGKLVLRDQTKDLKQRQAEATRIWNLILAERPDDALLTSQVADLFRYAQLKDNAFALYAKAVELAPGEPQYREYLGEYYHLEKQPEKAQEIWAAIASPPNRSAENLARVAEVYNSFGYRDQAIRSITDAVELAPKEFQLQIRAAEYHARAANYDEALRYIDAAGPLAVNDDQNATVVQQRIEVLESCSRLDDVIEEQRALINRLDSPSVADWQLLARYLEAKRDWPAAIEAIDAALEVDPKSIPALTTAVRISESAGNLGKAADMSRLLANADRRSKSDHLMNVARLEAQLGRINEAMEAANQLIIAAPGNTDNYEFFAQLGFRLGRRDEALDALRKAIRINPNEPRLTMALGSVLADEFKNREAIDLYWRAFDKTDDLDDKTSLMEKLVPLYQQLNEFDQLIAKLEQSRREEDQRRTIAICMAQAYQSADDYGMARYELEGLLSENTRDTNLLQQLAKLCKTSGDLDSAINYQRQLVTIAPGHETEHPLAMMLQDNGDVDEANEILLRLTAREEDPARLLSSLDSLLNQDNPNAVIKIVGSLVDNQGNDWELLYRKGVALAKLNETEQARICFEKLLAIDLPHETLARSEEVKLKQAQQKARSENLRGRTTQIPKRASVISTLNATNIAYLIRNATGLGTSGNSAYYNGTWTPTNFASARMAAYGWLMSFEQSSKKLMDGTSVQEYRTAESSERLDDASSASVAEKVGNRANQSDASRDDLYDWMYVSMLVNDNDEAFNVAKTLAKDGTSEEKLFFLNQITRMSLANGIASASAITQVPENTPLNDEEIELMLAVNSDLNESGPTDSSNSPLMVTGARQIIYAADGRPYVLVGNAYQPIDMLSYGNFHKQLVIDQLRLAGKEELVEQFCAAELAGAKNSAQLAAAMNMLLSLNDLDELEDSYKKWLTLTHQELGAATQTPGLSGTGGKLYTSHSDQSAHVIARWMGYLSLEDNYEPLLTIADGFLGVARKEMRLKPAEPQSSVSRPQQLLDRSRTQVVYWGETESRERVEFIVPGVFLSDSAATVLYQLYYAHVKSGRVVELVDYIEDRIDKADVNTKDFERAILATVLWWLEEQDECVDILTDLAKDTSNQELKLWLAELHFDRNRYAMALDLVDSIPVSDQIVLRERELMALKVAERLGDVERAKQAAERLFGLQLNFAQQLELASAMHRLGMGKMAREVQSRAERSSGFAAESLGALMSHYSSQGKIEEAEKIAVALLQRTRSPISNLLAVRPSVRVSSTPNRESADRVQAIKLLQKSGKLDAIIADLEQRIERYPDVTKPYELLAEYYEVAGRQDELLVNLEKVVKLTPKAHALRLKLAEIYQTKGRYSDACDQYIGVLSDRPELLAANFARYSRTFSQAKRTEDLIKVLDTVDLRQLGRSTSIQNIFSTFLTTSNTSEAAVSLLEKVVQQMPEYRGQLFNLLNRGNLIENDRIFELVLRDIVPTEQEINLYRWRGVFEVVNYSSNGQILTNFGQLLDSIGRSEKILLVEKAIQERLNEFPEWKGGELMLILIDLKSDDQERTERGQQRILEFCADDEVVSSMPHSTCWFLAQLVQNLPDRITLAEKLYKATLSKSPTRTISQIQTSPIAQLVRLYKASGKKAQAKELLEDALSDKYPYIIDARYLGLGMVKLTRQIWVAEQFMELGFPASAVKVYQSMLKDADSLQQTGILLGSNSGINVATQVKRGMDAAISKINAENAVEVVDELFSIDGKHSSRESSFDFGITFPAIQAIGTTKINSSFLDVALRLARDEAAGKAILAKLEQIHSEVPDDLSVLSLSAIVSLKVEPENSVEALNRLLDWIDAHPLEAIGDGQRPNFQQRRAAADQVHLWFVTRALFETPHFQKYGAPFARRAADAAARQYEAAQATSILYEWAIAARTQSESSSEEIWLELLDLALRRPARRSDQLGDDETIRRVPPLTQSQFDLVTKIAIQSADFGLWSISESALKGALEGGIPVPDPIPAAVRQQMQRTSFPVIGPNLARTAASSSTATLSPESKVSAAVNQILGKWKGGQYDSQSIMMIIHSFVFPESSKEEIRLYSDSSFLAGANVKSMGKKLVELAQQAKKLDWLSEEVKARQGHAISEIPAMVLSIEIALLKNEPQKVISLLGDVQALMDRYPTAEDAKLLCHALVPASEFELYQEHAIPLLATALKKLDDAETRTSSSVNRYSTSTIGRRVSEYYAKRGSEERLRTQFEDRLSTLQYELSGYTGDYGKYRQWVEVCKLANEAASLEAPQLAMEYMGRAVDMEVDRYAQPPMSEAIIATLEHTRKIQSLDAYRLWSEWTFPTSDGKRLRFFAEWLPRYDVPSEFGRIPVTRQVVEKAEPISNFSELISAAARCDRLGELRQRAEQAVKDGLLGAAHLVALLDLAEAAFSQYREADVERASLSIASLYESSSVPTDISFSRKHWISLIDIDVFLKCISANIYFDESFDNFELFEQRLTSGSAKGYRGILRQRLFEHIINRQAAEKTEFLEQPLKNWTALSSSLPHMNNRPALWCGDATTATYFGGAMGDVHLLYNYPILGPFEYTVDCYIGDQGECDAGYGGILVRSQQLGENLTISSLSGDEMLSRKQSLKTDMPSYGKYKIVSDGQNMDVFLNGYKVYGEKLSHTFPWLMLATEGGRVSRFMNPQLKGSPEIPREVNLIAGDNMDGWSTAAFAQSQPRRRMMRELNEDANNATSNAQSNNPAIFDWEAFQDMLISPRSEAGDKAERWIYYQRPILEGETFAYEFFYVPGVMTVAPTIGQLAMLMEPDGVYSHWISHDSLEQRLSGVQPDNRTIQMTYRRGKQLPLKQQAWNAVAVTINAGKLQVTLNDQLVFERPLDDLPDRRFGFFHLSSTDSRIRKVSLRGNWPERLPSSTEGDWFQWNREFTPQQQSVIQSMLPRDLDQPLLRTVVEQSRRMPAEEAIEYLSHWVLPEANRKRFRLGYAYQSLDGNASLTSRNPELDRVISPALELVRIAASAGKMNELVQRIEAAAPLSDVDIRNQRAMLLLAKMQQDDTDCRPQLSDIYVAVHSPLPKRLTANGRSAEFLVAVEAGRHQRYWSAGLDILERLRSLELDNSTASGIDSWHPALNAAIGDMILRWSGKDSINTAKQWSAVPYWKPQWNVAGERYSSWMVDRGVATHIPGDHWSQLFFQSPLRGEYEIRAKRSTFGYREVSIAAGMHSAEPRYDLNAVRVTTLMHNQVDLEQKVDLPVWDQSADFRIVVSDESIVTHVNDVEIHRQSFGGRRDPWLVLQADTADKFAFIRDLQILGSPTIPDEIDLIDIDNWSAWRFDVFGDWSSQRDQPGVPYNHVGDEIVGKLRKDRSASPMESLMMYARPMLEDGEIEFETFYESGQFEVHPAIGRTVLMMDQPQVTLHKLTNAQWDSTELPKNNRSEVAGATEELEWKEAEWNHVRLVLAGDRVKLFLNGHEVATHDISEAANQRFFGLFRFSDLTQCRVRNMRYRGNWPKTLPSIHQQELAYPNAGPYAMVDSVDVQSVKYELSTLLEGPESGELSLVGEKDMIFNKDDGLKFELTGEAKWEKWPGIINRKPVSGDCEITVSYADLDIAPVATGWGNSLVLQVSLDDPQATIVEVGVSKSGEGQAQRRAEMSWNKPDGQFSKLDSESVTGHDAAGRLRLVRDGGRIHCLVADGQSETFKLIHSFVVGPAKIRSFSVRTKSSDDQGAVSAVISDLILKENKRD